MNEQETALKIADFLLQVKAIKLQPNQPFTWASGWKSPIYCDNRITLAHTHIRTYIRQCISRAIEVKLEKAEVIAGVATAGIPQGVLVAQELGLPFAYVRSAPKAHGMTNMIEGEIHPGQKVVVIEDLVSTGSSSLKAVEALRQAGADVIGMVSIFTYGLDVAKQNFEAANCPLFSLCDYDALLKQALDSGYYITENDVATLQAWRKNPETWGK